MPEGKTQTTLYVVLQEDPGQEEATIHDLAWACMGLDQKVFDKFWSVEAAPKVEILVTTLHGGLAQTVMQAMAWEVSVTVPQRTGLKPIRAAVIGPIEGEKPEWLKGLRAFGALKQEDLGRLTLTGRFGYDQDYADEKQRLTFSGNWGAVSIRTDHSFDPKDEGQTPLLAAEALTDAILTEIKGPLSREIMEFMLRVSRAPSREATI